MRDSVPVFVWGPDCIKYYDKIPFSRSTFSVYCFLHRLKPGVRLFALLFINYAVFRWCSCFRGFSRRPYGCSFLSFTLNALRAQILHVNTSPVCLASIVVGLVAGPIGLRPKTLFVSLGVDRVWLRYNPMSFSFCSFFVVVFFFHSRRSDNFA